MKHTHKFIAAAVAVLFAIMPVAVQARYTEDTFYMQYAEGQNLGSLTYAEDTYSVHYGMSQETVDSGNIEMFGLSAQDHLIMLAHSDRAFSKLYNNSQIGSKINVTIGDNSTWYEVFNTYWIDQNAWENEDNMYNFYYTDTTPLTLITCRHIDGTRGRWIVQCTYANEPVQEAVVVEDVVYLPAVPDTNEASVEIIEEEKQVDEAENETLENIEEATVVSITPLNLYRMKMPWYFH